MRFVGNCTNCCNLITLKHSNISQAEGNVGNEFREYIFIYKFFYLEILEFDLVPFLYIIVSLKPVIVARNSSILHPITLIILLDFNVPFSRYYKRQILIFEHQYTWGPFHQNKSLKRFLNIWFEDSYYFYNIKKWEFQKNANVRYIIATIHLCESSVIYFWYAVLNRFEGCKCSVNPFFQINLIYTLVYRSNNFTKNGSNIY